MKFASLILDIRQQSDMTSTKLSAILDGIVFQLI